MFFIGGIDDQVNSIVWAQISNSLYKIDVPGLVQFPVYFKIFHNYLYPNLSNQPILWGILSAGLSLFGVPFFNFFVLFSLALAFASSYLLFRRYKYGIIFASIFTFSSYTWVHLGRHVAISQIWAYPLFLLLLEKSLANIRMRYGIILGVFLAIVTLISNYIGFFILLGFGLYIFLLNLQSFMLTRKPNREALALYVMSVVVLFIVAFPVLQDFVKANYFESADPGINIIKIERGIGDFTAFSSRPWYLLIPPEKNPVEGVLGTVLLNKLENWDYFLADDYFAGEHSANYFGFALIMGIAVSAVILLRSGEKEIMRKALFYYVLAGLVFLFMLPPYFTVSGLKVYTPGYIMYKLFPMFRVTARMSILVLLFLLLGLGESVTYVSNRYSEYKFQLMFLSGAFWVFIILETFIPVKVTRIQKPPEEFVYLDNFTNFDTRFAVYPYSLTDDSLFWLPVHKRYLINPRDYNFGGFNSQEFTQSLTGPEGVDNLRKLGADYLLVYKSADVKDQLQFANSPDLEQVEVFGNTFLYRVRPLE